MTSADRVQEKFWGLISDFRERPWDQQAEYSLRYETMCLLKGYVTPRGRNRTPEWIEQVTERAIDKIMHALDTYCPLSANYSTWVCTIAQRCAADVIKLGEKTPAQLNLDRERPEPAKADHPLLDATACQNIYAHLPIGVPRDCLYELADLFASNLGRSRGLDRTVKDLLNKHGVHWRKEIPRNGIASYFFALLRMSLVTEEDTEKIRRMTHHINPCSALGLLTHLHGQDVAATVIALFGGDSMDEIPRAVDLGGPSRQ